MGFVMTYVKILFSILVSLPILALGCWLFKRFFNSLFNNPDENDTVVNSDARRK